MSQALEGIKVIDLSCGMAGSVATMVLSDFGADVTKIESPEGDPYRIFPSFLHWSRGKKSALLDLENTLDLGRILKLVEFADVLVESFPPGLTDYLGIGYEALKTSHPDLVYCSITGFGPRGPYAHYKDYEGLVQAKSGRLMVFEGLANREGPGFSAVNVASHAAAMAAVRGASPISAIARPTRAAWVSTLIRCAPVMRRISPPVPSLASWRAGANWPVRRIIGRWRAAPSSGKPTSTTMLTTRISLSTWVWIRRHTRRICRRWMTRFTSILTRPSRP